ncbi:BlaI/MecI/CopY family transcriptional regulator [uncultured Oscillibacter sp.]|uniref:BlaI/MecI/CopY family transcriptional regulator n=1 Tax=uncultured Oscillibacter sp. TaxID=876091 RepID=UPI0025D5F55E|nr:BlaI/MecI/CopY family transcriptional regulator [uncultured Oscillibacter sp.]
MKLFDSELKVMDVLWRLGDRTAKEISVILGEETGWNVNTTYTVIKKCVAKGAVQRTEPNFLCHALVSKEEIRRSETEELIGRLFDGSPDLLFASLLSSQELSREQIARLREIVAEMR